MVPLDRLHLLCISSPLHKGINSLFVGGTGFLRPFALKSVLSNPVGAHFLGYEGRLHHIGLRFLNCGVKIMYFYRASPLHKRSAMKDLL